MQTAVSGASKENYIAVIAKLAEIYPQLYLAPGEESERLYPEVVEKGKKVADQTLSHFQGSPADDSRMVETPAGKVRVVTLGRRSDFITFLQIMGERCAPVNIPDTQGAIFLNGVINREIFFMPRKDALLILSIGRYSGVPAVDLGFLEEEWLTYSHTIRLFHECTHFVCYRLHPGVRDAVRDELIADAVGIIAAFGKYDKKMAERFLGICNGCYIGGRLENYIKEPETILPTVDAMLSKIEKMAQENRTLAPLELAICLDKEI